MRLGAKGSKADRARSEQVDVVPMHPKLKSFSKVIDQIHQARGSKKALESVVATKDYGDLMETLWRLTKKMGDNARDAAPEDLQQLRTAAALLRVPLDNLTQALAAVLPASVRFFVPPAFAASVVKESVNSKPKWFPGMYDANALDAAGTTKLYGKILETIQPKSTGKGKTAKLLRGFASRVRKWSEGHTTEVSKRLLDVGDTMSAAGLTVKDLTQLSDDGRAMVFAATAAAKGIAIDAHKFVADVRLDKENDETSSWKKLAGQWLGERGLNAASFADGISTMLRLGHDPDAWKSARICVGLSIGATGDMGGLGAAGKWLARGYAGAEAQVIYPTLDEMNRGVKPLVMWAAAGMGAAGVIGGFRGVAGRGTSGGMTLGVLVADKAEFAQGFGVQFPGILTVALCRDQAYGPYLQISRNPSLFEKWLGLAWLVPGITIRIYHPGFDPLVKATDGMCDKANELRLDVEGGWTRLLRELSGRKDKEGLEARWPSDARWQAHKATFDGGQAAMRRAEDILTVIEKTDPEKLCEGLSAQTREMLGYDADNPAATHATIVRYLQSSKSRLRDQMDAMAVLADRVLHKKSINKKELRQVIAAVKRESRALQWVDKGLLSVIVEDLSKAQVKASATRPRSTRPFVKDSPKAVSRSVDSGRPHFPRARQGLQSSRRKS